MFRKKLDNQGISKRFKTDELILVSTPIFLILIAIVVVLVAPYIVRYWEIDRCLNASGAYDYEKDECVVTRMEKK
jgi:uncharacterized sodium:solute symporter family permease YidK